MVQQNANIPDELVFSTALIHRGDSPAVGEPFVITYEIHNPTSEAIDIASLDACQILIDFEEERLGPSCNAGVSTIEPYAVFSLGHTMMLPSIGGDVSLAIQTPDGFIIDTYDLFVEDRIVQTTPLGTSINMLSTSFIQGELFDGSLTLTNDGDESELFRFTNTCRASYWIADASGVVFD